MTLPPDRSHVRTEQQHAESSGLDGMATSSYIRLMADEGRRAADSIDRIADELERFIEALVQRMRDGGRLVYMGAGTSGRLGVLDASECPPTFQSDPGQVLGLIAGGDSALRISSERREDDASDAMEQLESIGLDALDTVVGITAGGTTPWPLGGLAHASERGCLTALLCCARPEHAEVDHLLSLETGPEVLTGSTRLKAGTATKLALNTITTIAFTRLGKVHGNKMVDVRAVNEKLHDRAIRILMTYDEAMARSAADDLLARCDGELKTAIVALRHGVDPDAARSSVADAGGDLSGVLDD
ncbi:MAG: N-acetylmuramic acid 6-phosphate etherase [Phycisphaerales bacterium]|nr:N-acetylmuramic acid 6-phosphate etherase [Phycisphaerales bacterium]